MLHPISMREKKDTAKPFITERSITSGDTITLAASTGYVYDAKIDWGDGTITGTDFTGRNSHTYSITSVLDISISGTYERFAIAVGKDKIISIKKRGETGFINGVDMFARSSNLVNLYDYEGIKWCANITDCSRMFNYCRLLNPTSPINFTMPNCINAQEMFRDCDNLNVDITLSMFNNKSLVVSFYNMDIFDSNVYLDMPNIENVRNLFTNSKVYSGGGIESLDVSNCSNFNQAFAGCLAFDGDVSGWDVANGNDFSSMFSNCNVLNKDFSSWDLTNSTTNYAMFSTCYLLDTQFNITLPNTVSTNGMFQNCKKLNSNFSNLNMQNNLNISKMFIGCSVFDGNIDNMNLAVCTNAQETFRDCAVLNQDLVGFDGHNITNAILLFYKCHLFDGDVSGFITSSLLDMYYMFFACENFTGIGIESFDTSNVTKTDIAFSGCSVFNGNVSALNFSNVITASGMFQYCSVLDRDLSALTFTNITKADKMFWQCSSLNTDFTNFDGQLSTTYHSFLEGCSVFDGDVSGIKTDSATDLYGMFKICPVLNNNSMSGYITSNVTNFGDMFNGSSIFDGDITGFDLSSATNIYAMLYHTNFDRDISLRNIQNITNADYFITSLSTANYDLLLTGRQGQSHQLNVPLTTSPTKYTSGGAAETARNNLISDGRTISDGGPV